MFTDNFKGELRSLGHSIHQLRMHRSCPPHILYILDRDHANLWQTVLELERFLIGHNPVLKQQNRGNSSKERTAHYDSVISATFNLARLLNRQILKLTHNPRYIHQSEILIAFFYLPVSSFPLQDLEILEEIIKSTPVKVNDLFCDVRIVGSQVWLSFLLTVIDDLNSRYAHNIRYAISQSDCDIKFVPQSASLITPENFEQLAAGFQQYVHGIAGKKNTRRKGTHADDYSKFRTLAIGKTDLVFTTEPFYYFSSNHVQLNLTSQRVTMAGMQALQTMLSRRMHIYDFHHHLDHKNSSALAYTLKIIVRYLGLGYRFDSMEQEKLFLKTLKTSAALDSFQGKKYKLENIPEFYFPEFPILGQNTIPLKSILSPKEKPAVLTDPENCSSDTSNLGLFISHKLMQLYTSFRNSIESIYLDILYFNSRELFSRKSKNLDQLTSFAALKILFGRETCLAEAREQRRIIQQQQAFEVTQICSLQEAAIRQILSAKRQTEHSEIMKLHQLSQLQVDADDQYEKIVIQELKETGYLFKFLTLRLYLLRTVDHQQKTRSEIEHQQSAARTQILATRYLDHANRGKNELKHTQIAEKHQIIRTSIIDLESLNRSSLPTFRMFTQNKLFKSEQEYRERIIKEQAVAIQKLQIPGITAINFITANGEKFALSVTEVNQIRTAAALDITRGPSEEHRTFVGDTIAKYAKFIPILVLNPLYDPLSVAIRAGNYLNTALILTQIREYLPRLHAEPYTNSTHSPLMLAVRCGKAPIVELLLSYGVPVNHLSLGRTPLSEAKKLKLVHIAALLTTAGADSKSTKVTSAPEVLVKPSRVTYQTADRKYKYMG